MNRFNFCKSLRKVFFVFFLTKLFVHFFFFCEAKCWLPRSWPCPFSGTYLLQQFYKSVKSSIFAIFCWHIAKVHASSKLDFTVKYVLVMLCVYDLFGLNILCYQ